MTLEPNLSMQQLILIFRLGLERKWAESKLTASVQVSRRTHFVPCDMLNPFRFRHAKCSSTLLTSLSNKKPHKAVSVFGGSGRNRTAVQTKFIERLYGGRSL
jgi:hypothetical protein